MKQLKLEIAIEIIKHYTELSAVEQELCEAAILAKANAYAIYSNFQVGSSVLLENGKIISGSNQENAVYPLTLCAERVAIFAASHQYPMMKFKKIAVATSFKETENELAIFPCGSCRQVIREQEVRYDSPIEVLVIADSGKVYKMPSIQEILPFSFDKTAL
ncbi:MAG: cytidine deaminase [Saprospiraceae bacterium]|jgi:cytidine deaminase|tara:strand:- start:282 stop:764 length:483 start_codon:yes stop_codon:yes gene_type:complete